MQKAANREFKNFTFKDGAIVYLLAIGVNIGLQTLLTLIVQLFGVQRILEIDWVNILFSLVLEAAFVACVALYCYRSRRRFAYEMKKTVWQAYPLGALTAIVSLVCFIMLAQAFQFLLDVIGYKSLSGMEFDSLTGKILGVIVTVVAAPIGEELVFRGALLGGLKERYGVRASVLLSGLAFSLMHMNPEQTVYQFLLGVALAYLTVKSGSVIPAMIGHGVSNLIAVLMEFIEPFGVAVENAIWHLMCVPWLFALLTVALFAVGAAAVFFIGKLIGFCKNRAEEKQERTFTAMPPLYEDSGDAAQNADAAQSADTADGGEVKKSGSVGLKPFTIFMIGIAASIAMWLSVFAAGMIDLTGMI